MILPEHTCSLPNVWFARDSWHAILKQTFIFKQRDVKLLPFVLVDSHDLDLTILENLSLQSEVKIEPNDHYQKYHRDASENSVEKNGS